MLYTKSWLELHTDELPNWQLQVFQDFTQMINDDTLAYPCLPGRQGFMAGHLRFGFIGSPQLQTSSIELAHLLKQYGQCSKETGKYASLVVFTKPQPHTSENDYSVEEYEDAFWKLLHAVSVRDEKAWPSHISQDPADASWEFCFDGHAYFTFCATPAHQIRRSRFFPTFMLAFQPRWVFAEINDSTAYGRNIKKAIRQRLVEYDNIPAHPSLNWYGQKDSLEWKQYYLRDTEAAPAACPFAHRKNATSNTPV